MNLNFDATGHQPQTFDPLPSGWYTVEMIEGKETPSKNKPGNTYYAAVLQVLDGDYKGRKLFTNFNFVNDNEQAVKIAFDQLATICHAVGILKVSIMDQLFNKPFQAKVKLKPAVMEEDGVTEKYEAGNEVKGFKAVEGAGGAASGLGGGSLPEGFGDDAAPKPEAANTAISTAAATTATAAIPSTAAVAIPVAAKERKLVMTDKLPGVTAEQFRETDANWTDEKLVAEGYAKWVEVEPAKPAIPTATAVPSANTATVAAGSTIPASSTPADATTVEAEDDETPPWVTQ